MARTSHTPCNPLARHDREGADASEIHTVSARVSRFFDHIVPQGILCNIRRDAKRLGHCRSLLSLSLAHTCQSRHQRLMASPLIRVDTRFSPTRLNPMTLHDYLLTYPEITTYLLTFCVWTLPQAPSKLGRRCFA